MKHFFLVTFLLLGLHSVDAEERRVQGFALLNKIPSPCYVLEEKKLLHNLEILDSVQKSSGAKILVALKGFAFWRSFDLLKPYLYGITASGIYEARLGYETFG